jgi:fatty acid desaturase
MRAVLVDPGLLPDDQLRALSERRDGPSVSRLLAQSALYFGSAAALLLVDHPVGIAAALLVSGLVQFGMFGMLHEACHKTMFTRTWANLLAGWIAALGMPMSPALMRAFHFTHHRHTHDFPIDPELGGVAFMAKWPRGVMWIVTMTGLPVLFARFMWSLFAAIVPARVDAAWSKVLPFVTPERRRRVAWEARVLMAIHAIAIGLAATQVPRLWLVYAGMLLGHAILGFYITCEHRGLPLAGQPGGETILDRTRSLITPAYVRWLIWNMPYHAEHHGWPAVPWHALPQLHEHVRSHLRHRVRPLTLHLHGGRSDEPNS